MLDKIADYLEDFKDAGKDIIGRVKEGIDEVASKLKDAFGDAIEGMASAITELSETITDFGKSIVGKIVAGVEAVWNSKFVQAIKDGITGLATSAETALTAAVGFGKTIVSNIKSGVEDSWSTVTTAISTGISGIGTTITNAAENIMHLFQDRSQHQ